MTALFIRKLEGDFENLLVRDAKTRVAAHIQIPVGVNSRRVVVAMPSGKAALCFETAQPAAWAVEDDVTTFADEDRQNGVRFTLVSNADEIAIPVSSILLNHTLMARFGVDPDYQHERRLRDLIDSGAVREIEAQLGFSLQDLSDRGKIIGPVLDAPQRRITFTRRSLDGRHRYRMELAGEPATEVHASGGILRFSRRDPSARAPLRLAVRASTDFELFTPVPLDDLLSERGRAWSKKDADFAQAARNFEFLSFEEKFLAGSWNFLSYFGRDTLIALRIMWQVLSPRAKHTGIQSVANETSESGVVNVTDEWTDDRTLADALERFFRAYDQRDIEGARPIMMAVLDGSIPEHPFLDVLDQTFMFPSATALWLEELSDAERKAWLKEDHRVLGRTESNLVTLLRNWNYILQAASPYIDAWKGLRASYPDLTPRQIVEAHHNEFKATQGALVQSIAGAANWRDTYSLPWLFKSEDINVNLLPMAVVAIREMIERIRAFGGQQDLIDSARTHALHVLGAYLDEPGRFDAAEEAWKWDLMREHFLIRRDARAMRQDLEGYLEGLGHGEVVGQDRGTRERDAMLRCAEGGVTVSAFLDQNRLPEAVKDGIEFTALFIDPAGQPVPLMHSDDVFLLLFGKPSLEQVRKIVHLLMLPYPFGLGFFDDDIGMAVTSAVYAPKDYPALKDHSKNVWAKFGPDEYHGRAAWPWCMFALVSGIYDQVMKGVDAAGNLRDGVMPDDARLFAKILTKLKGSIRKLGPLATSEVYKFSPANAGEGQWQAEPMGISTPIQLWSAAPANLLIDEALDRINGKRPSSVIGG